METIHNLQSINDMRSSFKLRADGANLRIDCPMDGIVNAQVAIVAEAPGELEVIKKMPLVGPTGALLWKHLNKIGLSRKDVYVTNFSKKRADALPDGKRVINRHESDMWAQLLRWELCQLPNLRYVFVLGGDALNALRPEKKKQSITDWRGSVIPHTIDAGLLTKDVTLVVANNPAVVFREPKAEVTFRMDVDKLDRVIRGTFTPHVITPIINPTVEQVLSYIDELKRAAQPIAYDIEIISGETACVGLANNAHSGMCISFRDFSSNRYSLSEEAAILRALQGLFEDRDTRLIAQNGMFDMSWLWYKDQIKVPRPYFDTMLAHHTLYPQLPHGLGFIATQYTNHPYYKDEKSAWREGGDIDSFWEYNVKDCCITWEAHRLMLKELQDQGLDQFFFKYVMSLQPHLVRMTVGGILIDTELKERISTELHEEVGRKLQVFHDAVQAATGMEGYYPNPGSHVQMADLYFNKLRLIGRGTSTDADNRERMYKHPRTSDLARAVLDAVGDYAEDKKFLSTYADMLVDPDGRARCEYKQTGVQSAPGRLSSAAVMWGSGTNLQNQPRRAHPMFIADEGYTFVYFDLSQAEARYVGWDARIEKWIEQFERARLEGGYDAHRALASEMFNVPYDEVPTDDEVNGVKTIRFTAKRCRHGLNYRMGPDRLATTTRLPLMEATQAYHTYHRITPELRRWWMELEREVRANNALFNSFGRRLLIMERITPESLESIVAFRPQSTIGDKVSEVIRQCESDDRWPADARFGLNIHDADVALTPISKAKTVASLMKKYAESPIIVRPDMPPLIIPADLAIAEPDERGIRRWSTLKKVKGIEAAA